MRPGKRGGGSRSPAGGIAAALGWNVYAKSPGRLAGLAPGQYVESKVANSIRVGPRDVTIREPAQMTSDVLYIWDWADEDGDAVLALVNGAPAPSPGGSDTTIAHAPIAVPVPVRPPRRGWWESGMASGGITYAVHSASLKRAWINRISQG